MPLTLAGCIVSPEALCTILEPTLHLKQLSLSIPHYYIN